MNTYAKLAVAAAAVLIVGVIGYNLLPRQPAVGGPATPGPSTLPSASAAPSASPSASADFPAWYTGDSNGAGILAAGKHATASFVPPFSFTVPGGWVNNGDEIGFFALFPDNPLNRAEFDRAEHLAQEIFMGPLESPYFVCDAWEDNSGTTAAEIVAAMVANDALATSDPTDVTIGGLTGKQIDVRLDPAWTEPCPGDPPGLDLADVRTRVVMLDTADRGVIVVFVSSSDSADHEAFLAAAMPIIDSFQFEVGG